MQTTASDHRKVVQEESEADLIIHSHRTGATVPVEGAPLNGAVTGSSTAVSSSSSFSPLGATSAPASVNMGEVALETETPLPPRAGGALSFRSPSQSGDGSNRGIQQTAHGGVRSALSSANKPPNRPPDINSVNLNNDYVFHGFGSSAGPASADRAHGADGARDKTGPSQHRQPMSQPQPEQNMFSPQSQTYVRSTPRFGQGGIPHMGGLANMVVPHSAGKGKVSLRSPLTMNAGAASNSASATSAGRASPRSSSVVKSPFMASRNNTSQQPLSSPLSPSTPGVVGVYSTSRGVNNVRVMAVTPGGTMQTPSSVQARQSVTRLQVSR